MDEIRALTVRQPRAWAIIYGGKDVENRSRNIAGKYRGPVAIHAAKSHDRYLFGYSDDYLLRRALLAEERAMSADHRVTCAHWGDLPFPGLVCGAIIGVVDLVDVHEPSKTRKDGKTGRCSDWAFPGMWHLVLENPRPLPEPVPWKGQLGLWRLNVDKYNNWHTAGIEALL